MVKKNLKSKRLYEIGDNIKTLRTELGLSLRDIVKLLGKDLKQVHSDEQNGFIEPPWMRYAELYRDHPDLRGRNLLLALTDPDFLVNSRLYKHLTSIYGRDNLEDALSERTNKKVIEELQEKVKAFEWKESDIDCIRRRVGLLKKDKRGNPNWVKPILTPEIPEKKPTRKSNNDEVFPARNKFGSTIGERNKRRG